MLSHSIKDLVDATTGARLTIDFVTALVHEGKVFRAILFDSVVTDQQSQEMLIQVQDNPIHVNLGVTALGDAELIVFEGTTVSAAGTPITPLNLNRVSSRVSTAVFNDSPTITGDGTEIAHGVLPGGQRNQAVDTEIGGDGEVVLAPNTNYLIRVTNRSGSTARISTNVVFYEPDIA